MATQKFTPTKTQLQWLEKSLDPEVNPTVTAIAKAVGIRRDNWYQWQKQDGFVEWWNKAWDESMAHNKWWLDKIGIKKAEKDFRYWEVMQMKYANFSRKESIASKENKNINVRVVSFLDELDGRTTGVMPNKKRLPK